MSEESRRIIGFLEKEIPDENNPDFPKMGFLRCLYEVFDDGRISPINSEKFFCSTGKVFIPSDYHKFKKFDGELIDCDCIPANYSESDRNCDYKTRFSSASSASSLFAIQVFESKLPDFNDQVIYTDYKPYSKSIIINDQDFLYGPFQYKMTENDDSYKLDLIRDATPFVGNILPKYYIAKAKSDLYSNDIITHESLYFLNGLRAFFEKEYEKIDYISDAFLTRGFSQNLLKNSSVSRVISKAKLPLIENAARKMQDYKVHKERYVRLSKILSDAYDWDSKRESIINDFLVSTDKGRDEVKKYIRDNEQRYFESLVSQRKNEIESEIEDEIAKLKSQKEKLDEEIEERYLKKKELDEKQVDKPDEKETEAVWSEKLSNLKGELENESKRLELVRKEYEKYNSERKLKTALKDLEEEEDSINTAIARRKQTLKDLDSKIRLNHDELISKMLEVKPTIDVLTGWNSPEESDVESYKTKSINSSYESGELKERQSQYLDMISNQLASVGRNLDYSELVNIVVSIAQSQFVLFSGQPGTGKTSLAKLLGNAMGLNKRFLNIPVSKGWTSPRDILGFYNTLSRSFQAAPTGLYDLIKDVQNENASESSIIIALLDEFNLSQPEHYFSPFLEMSDPESERVIKTGDPSNGDLYIPDYFRFLGTINNDDSVQSLTPRMIDRCSIIHFSPPSDEVIVEGLNQNNQNLTMQEVDPVSATTFIDMFSPRSYETNDVLNPLMSKISSELSIEKAGLGNPITISYRKRIAIANYCNVIEPLLGSGELESFDIAFCQHILPLLNGFGEGFGNRLKSLKKVLPLDMERSKEKLTRLIESGETNLHSYRVIG